MAARSLTSLPALVCAALVLAGCGGEPPVPPDPRDSSLREGAAAALEAAGVDVVALEDPAGVTPDEVVAALDEAGLEADVLDGSDAAVVEAVGADPERLVGIPALVGDVPTDGSDGSDGSGGSGGSADGAYVAVVFTDPADAWLYAQSEPDVLAAGDGSEGDVETYLAGPVVAFTTGGSGDDLGDDVRRALVELAGSGSDAAADETADETADAGGG